MSYNSRKKRAVITRTSEWVFASGPGDLGSIPSRVIPKTQKMVLDASLLNTQHYKVRIKGKVEQSREGVAPSPTHWCSSYRKGSFRVTLDYGRQLTFTIWTKVEQLQDDKKNPVEISLIVQNIALFNSYLELFHNPHLSLLIKRHEKGIFTISKIETLDLTDIQLLNLLSKILGTKHFRKSEC